MKAGKIPQHFVDIDPSRCNGCVLCMKVCPMKAIRVMEDARAHIIGTCIDCGSCIRVCPKGAIESRTSKKVGAVKSRYTVVTVSPVFYTQFGDEVMPNEVILALREMFDQVYDQAYMHELFNLATQIYIEENRPNKEIRWPLISPICPVVNRIIYYRFPGLIDHILPFMSPREISGRELRKKAIEKSIFKPEEIGIYHITPCSAKMVSTKYPLLLESSNLDGVLGINELYPEVKKRLFSVTEEAIYHYSSGIGIGWAKSGGEIAGLEGIKTLAVSGIQETILYLEKIELGLLKGMEYVEFRACHEGCIGGQLSALDKYEAKRVTDRLVRMFGSEKRIKHEYVRRLYNQGFFNTGRRPKAMAADTAPDLRAALLRAKKIHTIWELLPQKDCGICGSPDCVTFAEDVVDGLMRPENCTFLIGRKELWQSSQ